MMNTRTRAKQSERGGSEALFDQLPPKRRGTRTSRQTKKDTSSAAPNPDSSAGQGRQPPAAPAAKPQPMQPKGSLVGDPIARRGAPAGRAPSIISIATQPQKADDASDEEDEDEDSNQDVAENTRESSNQGNLEANKTPNGDAESQEAEEAQRQVMMLSLTDLANASRDLMKRLQNPDYDNLVFRRLLKMKRNAFFMIRDVYEKPSSSPFIEWDWIDSLELPNSEAAKSVPSILIHANLITALDLIERVKSDPGFATLPLLEKLDDLFPKLFLLPGNNTQYLQLGKDIRIIRFVETLAAVKNSTDPRKVMISIFCDTASKKDFKELAFKGPYRSLGGLKNKELSDTCGDLLLKLWITLSDDGVKPKSPLPISQLREEYPLKDFLRGLKECVLTMCAASTSRLEQTREGWSPFRPDTEEFHSAEEDVGGSIAASVAESQPIIRLADSTSNRTLFDGVPSIQQLDDMPRYPSPTPESSLQTSQKRNNNEEADEDEEDDDEEFETDTRPVDRSKRGALTTARANAKRQRTTGPEPPSSASTSMPPPPIPPNRAPSSSAPQPRQRQRQQQRPRQQSPSSTAPPPSPSPLSSSAPDFAAIQRNKLAARQLARMQLPITYKQRHVWNDHDSAILIERIAERRAAWATIDKEDSNLFELPRNAQAYRDRARNMKVDFLITDSVLPQAFDLVTLSRKEIERLMRLGKNPARKEDDVDENGRPTNTDLRYEAQDSQDSAE